MSTLYKLTHVTQDTIYLRFTDFDVYCLNGSEEPVPFKNVVGVLAIEFLHALQTPLRYHKDLNQPMEKCHLEVKRVVSRFLPDRTCEPL